MSHKKTNKRTVSTNRRARHEYEVEDSYEAGLVLQGTEVKSLRLGKANLAHSFATVRDGEGFLVNADIPEYVAGNRHNHKASQPRKLLLHKRELNKLMAAVQRDGMTIVPLKLYFNAHGKAKLLLGLARGRKKADKRDVEKKRDWQRQKARLMR